MGDLKREVLRILENDSRLTKEQLAKMLNVSKEDIAQIIEELEQDGIILKYHTVINWEKQSSPRVTALIEVTITPQREFGFDKIAERIYRFPQVKSVYLMSGSYDLCVIIEGETMHDVSSFVSEKLAPLEYVNGTRTHFVMKRYKEDGVIFSGEERDKRLVVSP
ncbi:MAG: AsnC family transcriptional regulator [Peptococcaceae bacterium BICA1-8]|nr:MAG: AsnC family transcriptional regulator [Peptococcaceae bacterium BICA1-8]